MRGRERSVILALAVAAGIIGMMVWQSRQEPWKAYTKDLFAMDTYFSMTAYGPEAEDALERCAERVEELENVLSVTKDDSDVGKINAGTINTEKANAKKESVRRIAVSMDTLTIIEAALAMGKETEGALDITLYPVLREWGFTTGEYRIPEKQQLDKLLERVDDTQVETDLVAGTVSVPEGMELDLGALAKGYTGDCLLSILRERGVKSALLDLGGNIQTLGTKPDGSLWRVAVKDPFDTAHTLGVLEVADKAVITSGSYERYFWGEDGRPYWHILDSADGYPADNGLVSVTVVGDSGLRCDGLSTALFVMGKDKAVDLWRQCRDFEMILVTEEGELYLTEGLEQSFTCGEGRHVQIIYE